MAKVIQGRSVRETAEAPRDLRRSMSNHVATALIVYTGLQIFLTVRALEDGLPSILPYVALMLLVAGIIPACRWFEARWQDLSDERAADAALLPAFRTDLAGLWATAIGLPALITLVFRLAAGTI